MRSSWVAPGRGRAWASIRASEDEERKVDLARSHSFFYFGAPFCATSRCTSTAQHSATHDTTTMVTVTIQSRSGAVIIDKLRVDGVS